MTRNVLTHPWYREPWPWIIFSGPAVVVVASLFSAWLAVTHEDGVTADDYYKQGLAINQVLRRGGAADALGVVAEAIIEGNRIRVHLNGDAPPYLVLRVVHPTRAAEDQQVILQDAGKGWYAAILDPIAVKRAQLFLEDAAGRWRVSAAWHPGRDQVAVLRAHRE